MIYGISFTQALEQIKGLSMSGPEVLPLFGGTMIWAGMILFVFCILVMVACRLKSYSMQILASSPSPVMNFPSDAVRHTGSIPGLLFDNENSSSLINPPASAIPHDFDEEDVDTDEADAPEDAAPENDGIKKEADKKTGFMARLTQSAKTDDPQRSMRREILKRILIAETADISSVDKLPPPSDIEKKECSGPVYISSENGKNLIMFELDMPEAKRVALSGDFNNWCANEESDECWPFVKDSDGIWRTLCYLPGGCHKYKFVVDGSKWIVDPSNARTETDGAGGLNSLTGDK